MDEIPKRLSKFGLYGLKNGLKIESIILEYIDNKVIKNTLNMPSLFLAFQRGDLKVFMELDKFTLEQIRQIRDYILNGVPNWSVQSCTDGVVDDRKDLNMIEREEHKITIVCKLCDIGAHFTFPVEKMILEECIKIVGTD